MTGDSQTLNVYQHQRINKHSGIRASVISPGFVRVSKIERVSAQGNARKMGDKNPRMMAASEVNIEEPSE